MNLRKLFVLYSILLCGNLYLYSINFKHLGIKDGLSHPSVVAIYQDIYGRIWFGTYEGITIFDGSRFTVFKTSLADESDIIHRNLKGNSVTAITGDKDGNLFLIVDDILVKYDIRKQCFNEVRTDAIQALTSTDGEIYCVYNDSVFHYDRVKESLTFFLKTGLSSIKRIFISDLDQIWLGTDSDLYFIEKRQVPQCIISDVRVFQIYQSSGKEMWVSTWRDGLYRITSARGVIKMPYKEGFSDGVSSNYIRGLVEDNSGNIWFGTFDGLQQYNPFTNEFLLYKSGMLPGSLSHSSVHPLYKDNQGTIWIGTYWGGVNYFNPEKDLFSFYTYSFNAENKCLNYPLVGNIVEDRDGKLWICTEGGGLNCLDRKSKEFTYYTASGRPNALLHNNLKTICYDKKRHCLYVGTHTGGLSKFDITAGKFKNYMLEAGKGKALPGDIIHKVMCYENKLIVSARNGLFKMDMDTDVFVPMRNEGTCLTFDIDSKGFMWMIRNNGIGYLNLNNSNESGNILFADMGITLSATNIFVDDEYVYWGTLGAGFYRLNKMTNEVTNYTVEKDQLLSNYCYSIIKTDMGNLLITTDKGIMLYHPETKFLKSIPLGVGIPLGTMVRDNGVYECSDHELFIGGVKGMVSFWEDDIDEQNFDYNLFFTEMLVNNQLIYPDDETQILGFALPFTQNLDLNYTQNNLTFNFTVSNYIDIFKNNQYEYKLEGFDTDWVLTSANSLHYTNLPPGKYILKVRELQTSTGGIPKEASLNIVIHSPWYNTLGAWFFYILFVSLVLYLIWKEKDKRLKLSISLWKERKEKEQVEAISQAKLRFFTNISHEFRTPLTLILSHVDALLENNALSPVIRTKIRKVYGHAYRMKHLITELLDFRKFDQQQIMLHVSQQNIVSFLKEIYDSFADYAMNKGIIYEFHSDPEQILCWFDDRQMQKVFFNLLSNAFKYTSEGGHIQLVVVEEQEQIVIRVVDDGIGLSANDKKRVFDRFYQVETGGEASTMGTGIGLALTKGIVMMHQAGIGVESQLGYGSVFIVTLKKGNLHFLSKPEVIIKEGQTEPSVRVDTLPDPMFLDQTPQIPDNLSGEQRDVPRYTILLVEDNEELMQILIALFSPFYKVISAFNGKEGLEKANNEAPDIIVSDVMMPEMSGTEMCFQIKNNINLCHIPILLLSALNSDEQSLEGLKCGANDYVGKPFNGKILLLKCNNFMRSRTVMQGKMADKQPFDIKQLATNALDRDFLDKVVRIIEANLENESFDVNLLAQEMLMGRSSFFTKFKGLVGLTPNSFILDYKLKKAAELLINMPNAQIADIAVRLGFKTSHYFSKCFKAQFNLSPLEYRKGILSSE